MDTRLTQTTSTAATLVITALLGLGMLWTGARPAQAGGPTSVLLANSDTRQVAAYGYDDNDYQRLAEALDVAGDEPKTQPSPEIGDDFVHQIRLTWLMHDTSVWRVDILHNSPDGGWVIETRASPDGGDVGSVEPVWHRAKDPVALRAVITQAGLLKPPGTPTTPASSGGTAGGPGGMGGTGRMLSVGLGAGVLGLLGGLGVGWHFRDRWQSRARTRAGNSERVELIG